MYRTDLDENGVNAKGTGCFGKMKAVGDGHYWGSFQSGGDHRYHIGLEFESSLILPVQDESRPIVIGATVLLRLR